MLLRLTGSFSKATLLAACLLVAFAVILVSLRSLLPFGLQIAFWFFVKLAWPLDPTVFLDLITLSLFLRYFFRVFIRIELGLGFLGSFGSAAHDFWSQNIVCEGDGNR